MIVFRGFFHERFLNVEGSDLVGGFVRGWRMQLDAHHEQTGAVVGVEQGVNVVPPAAAVGGILVFIVCEESVSV